MSVLDERALWVQWKEQDDTSARDVLIMRYMRIVKFIAGRMAIHVPSVIEMDDLVGWGVLGLMDAVEKFDHLHEIKFSTYAAIRVRGSIIDHIRSLDWAPRSLRATARKVGAAREKLRHQTGRDPSPDDIAEAMGATAVHVEDVLAQLQTATILSLEGYHLADENEEGRRIDVRSQAGMPSPLDAALDHERQDRLVDAILRLPDQQQKVLNLYYYQELTLREIGAVLEVTESRVCQIHSAAMKALRKALRERE